MADSPLPTGFNGRDRGGRFAPGNRAARGNPLNRNAQQLRCELLRSVRPSDLTAVIRKLVALAKGGDVAAIKLLLDRLLGPPTQSIELDASVNSPPLYLDLADAVMALRRDSIADGSNGECGD